MSTGRPLKIVNADRLDGDKLIVSYSDDTTAIYSVEQLAQLSPQKTLTENSGLQEVPMGVPFEK
jgi:hypothetical protein